MQRAQGAEPRAQEPAGRAQAARRSRDKGPGAGADSGRARRAPHGRHQSRHDLSVYNILMTSCFL
jgi:hypothetical protein